MSTLTPNFYRRKPGHLGHLFTISFPLSRKFLTCLTGCNLGSPFNPHELEIFLVIILKKYTLISTLLILIPILILTPWCRVLLEKLTGLQLVKKFPAIHGTRRFIAALTSVRHLFLSWAGPIQSIYPHPTSCNILILSTHLRLRLPSGLLPSGFPSKTLYTSLS